MNRVSAGAPCSTVILYKSNATICASSAQSRPLPASSTAVRTFFISGRWVRHSAGRSDRFRCLDIGIGQRATIRSSSGTPAGKAGVPRPASKAASIM
jgi:hypothetical protein